MIVARRKSGEVEAAGWDCDSTRVDARDWLGRGLQLEIVTASQVSAIKSKNHVFSTTAAIGKVLSQAQAELMLS